MSDNKVIKSNKTSKAKGRTIPVYNIDERMIKVITEEIGAKVGPFMKLAALKELKSMGYNL